MTLFWLNLWLCFVCIQLFFDDVHTMHMLLLFLLWFIFNYIKYILNNGYFDLHTHSTVRLEIYFLHPKIYFEIYVGWNEIYFRFQKYIILNITYTTYI